MSKTQRVRWDCPNGKHPGVLASTRPPLDSVVRYCLLCTLESDRLVKRVAPALETQRKAAAAVQANKAKAKRAKAARERARAKEIENQRYIIQGVDMRDEIKRLSRLRVFGGKTGRLAQRRLTITPVSHPSQQYFPMSLHVVEFFIWPGWELGAALAELLRYLACLYVEAGYCGLLGHPRPRSQWYGPEFRQVMQVALKQAYQVTTRFDESYANAIRRSDRVMEMTREA